MGKVQLIPLKNLHKTDFIFSNLSGFIANKEMISKLIKETNSFSNFNLMIKRFMEENINGCNFYITVPNLLIPAVNKTGVSLKKMLIENNWGTNSFV